MLCISVPTVSHLYVWLLTAPRNHHDDYIDEELPETDDPVQLERAKLKGPSSALQGP
jgi:hypothetical protein